MAFDKKPKLCTDGPAGFQQINGLVDNLESLKDELELEHTDLDVGADEPSLGGATYEPPFGTIDLDYVTPGVHDSPLIPRGAAYVQQVDDIAADPTVRLYSAAGCLLAMQVLDVGVYFFPVDGFSTVWGRATPYGAAITPPLDARVNANSPSGTLGTGLIVRTFQLQTNGGGQQEMMPFHTGFFLLCYGRR